jgi:hypothetical protein
MPEPSKYRLNDGQKYVCWLIFAILILLHVLPFLDRYSLPHYDYGNVIHTIHYLKNPDLFGDKYSPLMASFYAKTAPLYFYGLVLPLSYIFSPKWALLVIGIVISFGCAYFAGGSWQKKQNLVVALLTLLLLIHCYLTPLEGNRRSFTGFFILGALWLGKEPNYPAQLIFVGLSACIYPPSAALIISYFGLIEITRLRNNPTTYLSVGGKLLGLLILFLLVLTPYWWDLLFSTNKTGVSQLANAPQYEFSNLYQFIHNFLVGNYGAFFREPIQFNLFIIFGALLLFQVLVLKEAFEFRKTYQYLLLISFGLWILAHLIHPLIYHPFKYTRLSLILGIAMPVFENLQAFSRQLYKEFTGQFELQILFLLSSTILLGVWFTYFTAPDLFRFLEKIPFVATAGWRFLLSLPVFLTILICLPSLGKANYTRSLLAGVVLSLMIYPYGLTRFDLSEKEWGGLKLSVLDGMFKVLESSPPGSTVAGPPIYYMDFVPAFAKRGVYGSGNLAGWKSYCERMNAFWKAYFSEQKQTLLEFLEKNQIDFLLVDQKMIQEEKAYEVNRCNVQIKDPKNPFLNQTFQNASWFYGDRLFLLSRRQLKRRQ